MGFKYTIDENEANRVVKYAIGAGINFFDTADMYSEGLSEEILGEAKGRCCRCNKGWLKERTLEAGALMLTSALSMNFT
jgi:diketogulonate reductase-like aldo/keto reductase